MAIKSILRGFELALGLRVNFNKRNIRAIGISETLSREITAWIKWEDLCKSKDNVGLMHVLLCLG